MERHENMFFLRHFSKNDNSPQASLRKTTQTKKIGETIVLFVIVIPQDCSHVISLPAFCPPVFSALHTHDRTAGRRSEPEETGLGMDDGLSGVIFVAEILSDSHQCINGLRGTRRNLSEVPSEKTSRDAGSTSQSVSQCDSQCL